jgi:hypothetical protein
VGTPVLRSTTSVPLSDTVTADENREYIAGSEPEPVAALDDASATPVLAVPSVSLPHPVLAMTPTATIQTIDLRRMAPSSRQPPWPPSPGCKAIPVPVLAEA